MPKKIVILSLVFVSLLMMYIFLLGVPKNTFIITSHTGNQSKFQLELATTEAERERGLMYRTELSSSAGMLFVFDDEAPRTFWMKNTFLTLDMIFLNSQLKIVDIIHNAVPCSADPCQTYPSHAKAQYVLEIKGDLTKERQMQVGDQAQWYR